MGDQMYQSCEKLRSIAYGYRGKEYSAYNTNKEGNWIGHFLSVNWGLKKRYSREDRGKDKRDRRTRKRKTARGI